MSIVPLFTPSDTRSFGNALFLSPSKLNNETQQWIADTVQVTNNSLEITAQDMLDNFQKENISAVGFVWSGDGTSGAFGSLQYFDWLKSGEPQMWLSDLCRFGPMLPTSPVSRLLDLFQNCLLSHKIKELWLMVEQDASEAKLCHVYEGYGFQSMQVSQKLNCVFMKKTLRT